MQNIDEWIVVAIEQGIIPHVLLTFESINQRRLLHIIYDFAIIIIMVTIAWLM